MAVGTLLVIMLLDVLETGKSNERMYKPRQAITPLDILLRMKRIYDDVIMTLLL